MFPDTCSYGYYFLGVWNSCPMIVRIFHLIPYMHIIVLSSKCNISQVFDQSIFWSMIWYVLKTCFGHLWPSSGIYYYDLYAVHSHTLRRDVRKSLAFEGILFLQDNSTPHKVAIMHQKLADLHFKVLKHPTYSPDLAPRIKKKLHECNTHVVISAQRVLEDAHIKYYSCLKMYHSESCLICYLNV
jgi:hypothetical protein